jgi:hypothetical protein
MVVDFYKAPIMHFFAVFTLSLVAAGPTHFSAEVRSFPQKLHVLSKIGGIAWLD